MKEYADKDLELMERFNLTPKEIDAMSDEELDEILELAQDEIRDNLEEGDFEDGDN